mmetsp:Transcript_28471/g.48133  ORF Transcript_28471/g.48133 Transcript_28471/m.48133 type:complete len:246 (-) Transcript_28471:976-1713(-)
MIHHSFSRINIRGYFGLTDKAMTGQDKMPQTKRHHGRQQESVKAPVWYNVHNHFDTRSHDEVEVECNHHHHHNISVQQGPLTQNVQPAQDGISVYQGKAGCGQHPTNKHSSQLDVRPCPRKEGDKDTQRVYLCLPHITHSVGQTKLKHWVRLNDSVSQINFCHHRGAGDQVSVQKQNNITHQCERHKDAHIGRDSLLTQQSIVVEISFGPAEKNGNLLCNPFIRKECTRVVHRDRIRITVRLVLK